MPAFAGHTNRNGIFATSAIMPASGKLTRYHSDQQATAQMEAVRSRCPIYLPLSNRIIRGDRAKTAENIKRFAQGKPLQNLVHLVES
jgi:hypothetical protein